MRHLATPRLFRWIVIALATAMTAAPAIAKLKVIATTSIIGDWVATVGGADVDVKILVGPDGDPHEYEPVPADSIAISQANLVFENGLGLETWLDKLYRSAQGGAKRIVVTDGIQVRHAPADQRGGGEDRDPHAWQSVPDAIIMVGNMTNALISADPAHAANYKTRSASYIAQLNDLDQWVHTQIQSIPPARRKLVTSHDAFGYFGDLYGIDISRSALESMTTEAADPSAMQIAHIVDQIKACGVPVIFLENIQNPKLIDQIAAEANVKVGPPLYSDALGPPGSSGDTYIKMIRYNVRTLVKALSQ
jgi:zinc/manganese transport system substrate-binding protein